ncbi:MAG: thiamine biosynthesis protein ThiJ [Alphaproteobacteria bacterium PA4]|nr:MAG: thiamine biosynthesis protein ThiJ [Alphaproteobacteria bacterium PA4]
MANPLTIVFPLYPQLTQLDFTGPFQFLSRLPGARTIVASAQGGEIEAEGGMVFGRTTRLADIASCDILCVPGGFTATEAALDPDFLPHIRRLGLSARYITSVCTGSLILGAAGLLVGKRAACHWHWRHLLSEFGAIPDPGRVVRDGNIFTGGGVTAGIDFALTLVAEIAGDDYAQTLQLGLEYAPAPPFSAGRPETAPPAILAAYEARMAPLLPPRAAQAREAAAAMIRV